MQTIFMSVIFDVYAKSQREEVRVGNVQATVFLETVTLEASNSEILLEVAIDRGIGSARDKAVKEWETNYGPMEGLRNDLHFRVVSHSLIGV